MADQSRPYHLASIRANVQEEILARVAAGEFLTRISREPRMPSHFTLQRWRRLYPPFAEALAAAERRGHARRRWAFDEARAAAFLARLRTGESVGALTGCRGAVLDRRLYLRWMGTEATFHSEVVRLVAQNRRTAVDRTRRGPWAYDPAIADRMVALVAGGRTLGSLDATAGFPCRKVLDRWRRAEPEFDKALRIAIRVMRRRAGARAACALERMEPVLDLVLRGVTLASAAGQPGVPTATTLYRRQRLYPEFARAVEAAKAEQADWLSDRLWELTKDGRRRLRTGPRCGG